jgi:hypothetical protein
MLPSTKKLLLRHIVIITLMTLAILLLLCSCITIYPILGYGPSRLGDLSGEPKIIGILPNGNYLVTPGLVKEYMNLCIRESSYDDDFPNISLHVIAEIKALELIVQKHESKYWPEFDYDGIAWEVYPFMAERLKNKT